MTFPTPVADDSWTTAGSATTTHKAKLPAGIQKGDLILVQWARVGTPVGTLDSAFTHLASQVGANPPNIGCRVGYRIADGTETAGEVTFLTTTSSLGVSYCSVWRNFSGLPVASSFLQQNSTTAPNPPNLASGFDATLDQTWLALIFGEFVAASITGFPSGYASTWSVGGAGGAVVVGGARRDLAAASEDPGAFAISPSDNSYVLTVSVPGAKPRSYAVII